MLHGMGNLATCRTCHSETYCSRCHAISLPHPGAWLTTHGKLVLQSKAIKDSCGKCHQGSLCKNCHKIQIPHPSDFLNKHSKLVKKQGEEICYGCHLKEACSKCHSYHIHPGIPQNKLKILRKEVGLN
jgi:predicted CXXCH cytochrome family protein